MILGYGHNPGSRVVPLPHFVYDEFGEIMTVQRYREMKQARENKLDAIRNRALQETKSRLAKPHIRL
jgi:hypothetical protein